jgi:hypothetical protein
MGSMTVVVLDVSVDDGLEMASIADEEAERNRVPPGNEAARLLRDPGRVGIGGHARQVHPTGGDLDEKESIETSKEGGVDRLVRRDVRLALAHDGACAA